MKISQKLVDALENASHYNELTVDEQTVLVEHIEEVKQILADFVAKDVKQQDERNSAANTLKHIYGDTNIPRSVGRSTYE